MMEVLLGNAARLSVEHLGSIIEGGWVLTIKKDGDEYIARAQREQDGEKYIAKSPNPLFAIGDLKESIEQGPGLVPQEKWTDRRDLLKATAFDSLMALVKMGHWVRIGEDKERGCKYEITASSRISAEETETVGVACDDPVTAAIGLLAEYLGKREEGRNER